MRSKIIAFMGGVGLVLIALGTAVRIFGGEDFWLVTGLALLALATSSEAGWARAEAKKALDMSSEAYVAAVNALQVAQDAAAAGAAAHAAARAADKRKSWPYGG